MFPIRQKSNMARLKHTRHWVATPISCLPGGSQHVTVISGLDSSKVIKKKTRHNTKQAKEAGDARNNPNTTEQEPQDADDWGIIKGNDGILVGHPPEYPPGLLDWDDQNRDKKTKDFLGQYSHAKMVVMEPFALVKGVFERIGRKVKESKERKLKTQQTQTYKNPDGDEDSDIGSDWVLM